jgi:sulfatase modifying factor 1
MGSPGTEKGPHGDERPYRLCVGDFAVSKHEVTNGQYRRFRSGHDNGEHKGRSLNGNDRAVVEVSWEDGTAYAEWLSRKTGQRYRPPPQRRSGTMARMPGHKRPTS